MTFEQIKSKAAAKFGYDVLGETLGSRVDYLLDSARINADDTVYLEKAAPVNEWERIALDSLRFLLSDSKDTKAQAWFRSINFVW